MSWLRIDDAFARHPKVLRIPRARRKAAVGLWTLAGTWIAQNLTDGHLPAYMVDELDATPDDVADLLDVGLWDRDGDDFRMHDYLDYNPSREQVLAERHAAKQRQRRARERSAERRSGEVQAESRRDIRSDERCDDAVTSPEVRTASRSPRPDPTRPDLQVSPTELPVKSSPPAPSQRSGTRIADGFAPDTEMVTWARANCPEVPRAEHERFIDYWRGQPGAKGRKVDWPATWRNWMRRAQDDITAGRRPSANPAAVPISKTDVALADLAARKAAMRAAREQEHFALEGTS